jgi:hypothetical protein
LATTFCEEVNLIDDVIDETVDMKDALENEEDDLNNDIQLIAKELAADFKIGDWIVVPYFMQWYPAIIKNVRSFNTIILYFCVLRSITKLLVY